MPGRGGAGNILVQQQQAKRGAEDLEANQQIIDQSATATSADSSLPREKQQYAYTGRGGAGNWYSPQELKQTGTYDDRLPAAASAQAQQAAVEPVRKYGRGGAGNMSFGVSEDEERAIRKRMEEEEAKREKVAADVEANVNAMLPEPPKAKLSGPP
ncbi:hypothetical protein HII31_01604 [Pseudocercospora fuligena]|uniref:Uncharacterized protein n=1 Tax=Pseudocercospora fuligena TaxID=685502 RepID=A0A8H6RRF8_9PEZI|nr:hypothetical protein HII31_03792 [Pseudocercospora fuligena]KAF7197179.1 hypothetical protein HII31_01604 [Pseudocercospora fuligena]